MEFKILTYYTHTRFYNNDPFYSIQQTRKNSQVVSPFMKLGNIAPREITHFIVVVVVKMIVEHLGNKECLCT